MAQCHGMACRSEASSPSADDSRHAALIGDAIEAMECSGLRLQACGSSDREILQRIWRVRVLEMV
eukprot:5247459-Amphidinium_carterae.1